MNGKSLMMLGLAVVFGLVAMLLTRQMLAQAPTKAEETQEVLVAARDIKEEEMLKPDTVKVVRMAKSAIPVGAMTNPKDVEERWVKTALLEGDMVIEKKLGPKGTPPGLVANIPKGMRAFAIDVTEQTGVSGFVLPGHRVDVIRYEPDHNASGQRAESILQDILVLASGQVFTRAEERSLATRTVTLAVTPEQVDVLVTARARGQLSLSLRGVNDHDVVAKSKPQPKPVVAQAEDPRWKAAEEHRAKLEKELAELKVALAAKAAAPPPPAPAPPPPPARPPMRHVHIYRGGRGAERIALDGQHRVERAVLDGQPVVQRVALDGQPAAEPGGRQPGTIPDLEAIEGLVGAGPAVVARPQPGATASIHPAAGTDRPGS